MNIVIIGGSRIVLIGSTSGIRRDRGGIYGISKWALRSYAYALREECKPMGIGVSLINPGGTFTETRKKSSEEDRSLLETSDLGKVIALTFRLSPQAVLEEVNIRPLQGDTYRQSMDCLFSSQGNSLNVKKKYGMIKGRTEKDTLVTEVFRYNGTVQAGIY